MFFRVAFTLADRVEDLVVGLGVVRLMPLAISFLQGAHFVLPDLVLLPVKHAIAISVSFGPGTFHPSLALVSECLIGLVPLKLSELICLLFLSSVCLPLGVLLGGPGVDQVHCSFAESDCFCHFLDFILEI